MYISVMIAKNMLIFSWSLYIFLREANVQMAEARMFLLFCALLGQGRSSGLQKPVVS